jgi:Protein of unknown function (DUF3888)
VKNLLVLTVLFTSMIICNISVSAENQHKHDSKGMEQAFDHFMLSQFNDEIGQAVREYYKKDSVRIQYDWWEKKDVVEVFQSEKGSELSHPFVIRFNVLSYNSDKLRQLGKDSITFGVSPLEFNKELDEKNLAAAKVELLKFEHVVPSKVEKN